MKKLLCILLVTLLVASFCGCTKTGEELNQPATPGNSFGENQPSEQAEEGFTPDFELLQERIRGIYSVNVNAISGKTWGDYSGFDSPDEISADGLLNFFLSGDGNPYYNASEKEYVYSVGDIEDYLSQYFWKPAFHSVDLKYWDGPDSNGIFHSKVFIGFDPILNKVEINSWDWDSSGHLLTLNGSLLPIEGENDTESNFTAVFRVSEDHYYCVSFHQL